MPIVKRVPLALSLVALILSAVPARAVIVFPDPGRNLESTTPDPYNLGSLEGQYGNFTATPISADYAITAAHVSSADPVVLINGTYYHVAETIKSSDSDLQLLRIDGTSNSTGTTILDPNARFSSYAPIYSSGNELNDLNIIVFGRGVGRGAEVTLDNTPKGWLWDYNQNDHALSWGLNTVSQIIPNATDGQTQLGDLIAFNFTKDGCTLAANDSGGGVFINDHGVWKLAGINFGVDGPYYVKDSNGNYQPVFSNSGGLAALYDQSGYYVKDGNNYIPVSGPQSSYATRLASASNLAFLSRYVPVPEPGSLTLLAFGAVLIGGVGRRWAKGRGDRIAA